MLTFREFNLLNPFFPLGKFDIIFCRNVLIYFAESTKKDVLHRLAGAMNPEGYLFLGSAETVLGLSEGFARPGENICAYRLRGASPRPSAAGNGSAPLQKEKVG